MSLNENPALLLVAQKLCRDLRKRMTPAEKRLWNTVRDRRFQGRKFYRQHPLFFDFNGKETFFISDFYCHESRLVVEIDGKVHDYTRNHDEYRTHIIERLGIRVIRFRNEEIKGNMHRVLARLEVFLTHPVLGRKGHLDNRRSASPSLFKRRSADFAGLWRGLGDEFG